MVTVPKEPWKEGMAACGSHAPVRLGTLPVITDVRDGERGGWMVMVYRWRSGVVVVVVSVEEDVGWYNCSRDCRCGIMGGVIQSLSCGGGCFYRGRCGLE